MWRRSVAGQAGGFKTGNVAVSSVKFNISAKYNLSGTAGINKGRERNSLLKEMFIKIKDMPWGQTGQKSESRYQNKYQSIKISIKAWK